MLTHSITAMSRHNIFFIQFLLSNFGAATFLPATFSKLNYIVRAVNTPTQIPLSFTGICLWAVAQTSEMLYIESRRRG